MAKDDQLPKFYELMNPLLQALRDLGGSSSIEELAAKVTESLDLPDAVLNIPHDPEKSSQTEVEYRLAWARTYLKKYGVLDNSERGVWVIVPEKRDIENVDPQQVVRTVRELNRQAREAKRAVDENEEDFPEEAQDWRSKLHHVLTKEMSPDTFERLVKRMLRESGFVQVEVTGRSGDGGIDGKGIIRIGGLLSFHVLFQCKRYQGSVSPSAIRDFRGALVGRADKGLFVTTGTFTREATREATRDGATPIDLMDGDQLADKLNELRLGVRTEMVESVDVDAEWFRNL
ncbi:MAG: restriction endonuclease [Halieaceae bacterium]|jgi:restriction system protein|nr:restriction endonuclease [Halieaceae bacterium]